MPGSPLDPRCRGANDLLRHGATLTETAADVLAQLGPLLHGGAPPPPTADPAAAAGRTRLAIGRAARRVAGEPAADEDALDTDPRKTEPDAGRG